MAELSIYKGYQASVNFSDEDGVYFGKILGIDDLISFEGDTPDQLQKAFEKAVEDHIDICKELGKTPLELLLDRRLKDIEEHPEKLRSIEELYDCIDKEED